MQHESALNVYYIITVIVFTKYIVSGIYNTSQFNVYLA